MTTRQEVAAKLLAALISKVSEDDYDDKNWREEMCNTALDWADTLLTMEREN